MRHHRPWTKNLALALWILLFPSVVGALDSRAKCGDILEGEFTKDRDTHNYLIDMQPGEVLKISVVPVGDFLSFGVVVFEPAGNKIHWVGIPYDRPLKTVQTETGILSARGTYQVHLNNKNAGIYTIQFGCVRRDGTVVEPGARQPPPPPAPPAAPPPGPPVSPRPGSGFRGFPGLDPIDLSGIAFPKLGLDVPLDGTISARGQAVFGFRFEGGEGAWVELEYQRTAGSRNLALVLLDGGDKVVFQASLVTSETLATRLRLPTAGDYTLAVAAIELLPPRVPADTSFRIVVGSAGR